MTTSVFLRPPSGADALQPPPPYATPLRAVDRVVASVAGGATRIRAELSIGDERDHLRGHFPGQPVYPGVGVLESVTQALTTAVGNGRRLWLRDLRSARFRAPIPGGDTLRLEIEARRLGERWQVDARGTRADGSLTATAKAAFDQRGDLGGQVRDRRPPPATGRLEVPGIVAFLPHRHPFLLVDRVRAIEAGRRIWAEKAVTATEPCYRDAGATWAPDAYTYPAALMLESLGQAAALLWLSEAGPVDAHEVLMLAAVRGYQVIGQAHPGDVLSHVVELEQVKADVAFASGATWASGRCVATVDTLIAVRRPRSVLDVVPADAVSNVRGEDR